MIFLILLLLLRTVNTLVISLPAVLPPIPLFVDELDASISKKEVGVIVPIPSLPSLEFPAMNAV